MTSKEKELIEKARRFLEALGNAYGNDVANKAWEDFLKTLPNGQALAHEILLEALKTGPLKAEPSPEEEYKERKMQAVIDQLRRERDLVKKEAERAKIADVYEVDPTWVKKDNGTWENEWFKEEDKLRAQIILEKIRARNAQGNTYEC